MRRPVWLFPLSLVLTLLGCSEATNGTGMISKRLGEAVHDGHAAEVDLAQLTTFGWEYFYATKPGVSREEVCSMIGADRRTCGRIVRIERAPSDHMYLLFGQKGNLTHVELHAVENGRFDVAFGASGHPRSRSVFRVRRSSNSSDKDAIILEPK